MDLDPIERKDCMSLKGIVKGETNTQGEGEIKTLDTLDISNSKIPASLFWAIRSELPWTGALIEREESLSLDVLAMGIPQW